MTSRLTALSRSIAGRRALVTGAGSGMGQATARLFADEGARVAVVDLEATAVAAVVDEIRAAYGPAAAVGIVVDLRELAEVNRAVAEAAETLGGLDIVVNNAGISLVTTMAQDEETFEAAWASTLAVNLTAYARVVRAALPFLRVAPDARVVNIASTEAVVATPGIAAYSASKAGVTGLTRSMAMELSRAGITVNCICPGPILTGMTAAIPQEAKLTYAQRRVPLRRYGDPEEVAHMVLNLCLPSSGFVTGATVPVDGGLLVKH